MGYHIWYSWSTLYDYISAPLFIAVGLLLNRCLGMRSLTYIGLYSTRKIRKYMIYVREIRGKRSLSTAAKGKCVVICEKPTASGVPRRSTIQVLTGIKVAYLRRSE